MVSKLARIMTDFIAADDSFEQTEYDIYKYGFTLIIEIFLVTIVSVILAFIMGKFKQCVVFFLTFIPLRKYGGGYHLSSFKKCFLLSVIAYEIVLLTTTYVKLNFYLMIGNYIILSLLFFMGPAFNNTNFDNVKKIKYKNKYRLLLLIIGIIFMIMYKNCNLNAVVIFLALLLSAISGGISKIMQYIERVKTRCWT